MELITGHISEGNEAFLVFFALFSFFALVIFASENKLKEDDNEQEDGESEDFDPEKLEKTKIIAKELQGEIFNRFKNKYLGLKLYNKIFNDYIAQFNAILEFKKYLKEDFDLLFNFFEDLEYRDKYNQAYITICKENYRQYFIDLDDKKNGLTEKQLEAVFVDEDATLVNAGAGTGKTKTIESKILYLVSKCDVPLDRILVMTFSKKSQQDMLGRITDSLKKANITFNENSLKRTVTTFHAFGKGILDQYNTVIDSNENRLIGKGIKSLSVLEETQKMQILTKVFKTIKKDSLVQKLISEFILYYSSPQVLVSKFNNLSEYYQYTKNTYKTLIKDSGYNVTVKSYGEVLIANFLWLNNINVEYEPKNHFYTDEITGDKKPYKPDFYLPDHNIYIEYFGIDENGNTAPYISNNEYIKRVEQKIYAHKVSQNILIDMRYADLQKGQEDFLNKFENQLEIYGISLSKREYNSVIETQEISGQLAGISKILNIFLSLYKESGISINELKEKIEGNFDFINLIRNRIFLHIFEAFLSEYQRILKEEGFMDFGDMIFKAVEIVKSDSCDKNYDYILIDEFQDISKARALLIKGLLEKKADSKLFCVGDDWQSIYQFAGSDTNIFLDFKKYFGFYKEITLDKTFRFNQGISEISSSFVMMNKYQKTKQLISLNSETENTVFIVQKKKGDFDYFFEILNNIVKNTNKLFVKVLFLTRYSNQKYDDGFFEMLSEYKKNVDNSGGEGDENIYMFRCDITIIELTLLTSHKSKGLEADYVIVDYVNQGDFFDFPSNFEDDPILGIISNDKNDGYPFAEERRLFYVSITRGKKRAFIVYTKGKESIFLKDLLKINKKYQNKIVCIFSDSNEEVSILSDDNKSSCPRCGGVLKKRIGKNFEFYGCSNYPQCSYTQNIPGNNNPQCPLCGSTMVIRKNKLNGEEFWGCVRFVDGCMGNRKKDSNYVLNN